MEPTCTGNARFDHFSLAEGALLAVDSAGLAAGMISMRDALACDALSFDEGLIWPKGIIGIPAGSGENSGDLRP